MIWRSQCERKAKQNKSEFSLHNALCNCIFVMLLKIKKQRKMAEKRKKSEKKQKDTKVRNIPTILCFRERFIVMVIQIPETWTIRKTLVLFRGEKDSFVFSFFFSFHSFIISSLALISCLSMNWCFPLKSLNSCTSLKQRMLVFSLRKYRNKNASGRQTSSLSANPISQFVY